MDKEIDKLPPVGKRKGVFRTRDIQKMAKNLESEYQQSIEGPRE